MLTLRIICTRRKNEYRCASARLSSKPSSDSLRGCLTHSRATCRHAPRHLPSLFHKHSTSRQPCISCVSPTLKSLICLRATASSDFSFAFCRTRRTHTYRYHYAIALRIFTACYVVPLTEEMFSVNHDLRGFRRVRTRNGKHAE